jgi:hypothetical protein
LINHVAHLFLFLFYFIYNHQYIKKILNLNWKIVKIEFFGLILIWYDKTSKLNITTIPSYPFSLTILSNDEIVSGCKDGEILIYLSDGTLKQTLNAFSFVNKVASYLNDVIVSAADDNIYRIWTKL